MKILSSGENGGWYNYRDLPDVVSRKEGTTNVNILIIIVPLKPGFILFAIFVEIYFHIPLDPP